MTAPKSNAVNDWSNYTEKIPFADVEMTLTGSVKGDTATVKVHTQFEGGLNQSRPLPTTIIQDNTYNWNAVKVADEKDAGEK